MEVGGFGDIGGVGSFGNDGPGYKRDVRNLQRFIEKTRPRDQASKPLRKRMGFRRRGLIRQHEAGTEAAEKARHNIMRFVGHGKAAVAAPTLASIGPWINGILFKEGWNVGELATEELEQLGESIEQASFAATQLYYATSAVGQALKLGELCYLGKMYRKLGEREKMIRAADDLMPEDREQLLNRIKKGRKQLAKLVAVGSVRWGLVTIKDGFRFTAQLLPRGSEAAIGLGASGSFVGAPLSAYAAYESGKQLVECHKLAKAIDKEETALSMNASRMGNQLCQRTTAMSKLSELRLKGLSSQRVENRVNTIKAVLGMASGLAGVAYWIGTGVIIAGAITATAAISGTGIGFLVLNGTLMLIGISYLIYKNRLLIANYTISAAVFFARVLGKGEALAKKLEERSEEEKWADEDVVFIEQQLHPEKRAEEANGELDKRLAERQFLLRSYRPHLREAQNAGVDVKELLELKVRILKEFDSCWRQIMALARPDSDPDDIPIEERKREVLLAASEYLAKRAGED